MKPEWVAIKENGGANYQETMANRPAYNARGYTSEGVRIGEWHNALSYDEETHFRSVEYLRAKGADKDSSPFLLCASYHHPHEPFWPPEEYWNMYDGAEVAVPDFSSNLVDTYSEMDRHLNAYHGVHRYNLRDSEGLYRLRRAYYGLVTYMDRKLGELLETLRETGLADNTVVVFTSDHGDMLCEKEMVQKRCFYEWSCRVPLIVRFPDRWKAGEKFATPVSLLDLLPTFCDLARVDDLLPHDGRSLMSLLQTDEPERVVVSQAHEAVGMPCIMARQGRFKFNYFHGFAP